MKDKMIFFVIGLLLGAVISAGAFYIYTTTNSCNNSNQGTQISGGQPPELPSGKQGENTQPPEMPNGSNNQNNNTQESS